VRQYLESGLKVQVSLAAGYDIFDNPDTENDFSRYGAWVTASYTPSSELSFNPTFIAFARRLTDKTGSERDDSTDFGASAYLELMPGTLNLSGEYLHGSERTDGRSSSYSLSLECKVASEITVVAGYGRGFKQATNGDKDKRFTLSVKTSKGVPFFNW
jgi:hypothetical protein